MTLQIWGSLLAEVSSVVLTILRPNTTEASFGNEKSAQFRTIEWGTIIDWTGANYT